MTLEDPRNKISLLSQLERRQDDVLDRLTALNSQVEQIIKKASAATAKETPGSNN